MRNCIRIYSNCIPVRTVNRIAHKKESGFYGSKVPIFFHSSLALILDSYRDTLFPILFRAGVRIESGI